MKSGRICVGAQPHPLGKLYPQASGSVSAEKLSRLLQRIAYDRTVVLPAIWPALA